MELRRKVFHLLSLLYAFGFGFLGRGQMIVILGFSLMVVGGLEIARFKIPFLNEKLLRGFGGIHRPEESRRFSGIYWTLLGCFFCILLYGDKPQAVMVALLCLALGDTAAALVGKHFQPLATRKTMPGFLACWLVSFICGLAYFPAPVAACGALVAALTEIAPLPFNDNFWIPVVAGLFFFIAL